MFQSLEKIILLCFVLMMVYCYIVIVVRQFRQQVDIVPLFLVVSMSILENSTSKFLLDSNGR